MVQFSKVLLAIDNAHTVPQRALDRGLGLGGLNQVYRPWCIDSCFSDILQTVQM